MRNFISLNAQSDNKSGWDFLEQSVPSIKSRSSCNPTLVYKHAAKFREYNLQVGIFRGFSDIPITQLFCEVTGHESVLQKQGDILGLGM